MANEDAIWTPEPGVYQDVPAETYHICPYASSSKLGHLVPPSTPAKLKTALDEPVEKKVWREGRALHCAVFEPARYAAQYRVAGTCIGMTKGGERCKLIGAIPVQGGEVCGKHADQYEREPDVLLVSPVDAAMVERAAASIRAHPLARAIVDSTTAMRELSLVWDQPVPALSLEQEPIVVRMKARLDIYDPELFGGLPADLKGVREAHTREFQKQALWNGYLRQSVIYRWALRHHGMPFRTFVGLAAEKTAPFDLIVYRIGDEATGLIWQEGEPAVHVSKSVLLLLRLWHECTTRGVWPGYPREIVTLTTPEWAWSEIDRQCDALQERIDSFKERED